MQGPHQGCQSEPSPTSSFWHRGVGLPACGCHLQEPVAGQERPTFPVQMGHSTLPGPRGKAWAERTGAPPA